MRESKKGERSHLQAGSYERWLGSQKPGPSKPKHRSPLENVYETWLEKRVQKKRGRKTAD
jgi:hypothetical protein